MTSPAKLGVVAVTGVLIVVVVVQSVLLLQRQQELTRYRASDQSRRDFCLAYAGMISAVSYGLKAARETAAAERQPANESYAWVFVWLTNPAFLKVCNVPEPTRSKLAEDTQRGCMHDRTGGFGATYDVECLEMRARELERAISLQE